MNKPVIGFVGLTHLGLNSAAASAEHGFATVCFDRDAALVDRLGAGRIPVVEPGLDEALANSAGLITFSNQTSDIGACDVIYVSPDVATDDCGKSDLGAVVDLLALAVDARRSDAAVVVLSQVPPGFTRLQAGGGDAIYYQVETLIFGLALERAKRPERIIIGCNDPASALHGGYAEFLRAFGCPILPMRYESAELAKIAINCCLVATISAANTLAELCERIDADWSEIVPALRLDRRIGAHAYLSPGLGLSGGNLERDLATVMGLSADNTTDSGVVASWITNSRHRKNWVAQIVRSEVPAAGKSPRIAILGLAYKENTHSTKNSPALSLIQSLTDYDIIAFDPVVPPGSVASARDAGSAMDAVAGADIVAIMTPWTAFRELDPVALAADMTGLTVIDPYQILDSVAVNHAGLDHFVLGARPRRAKTETNP